MISAAHTTATCGKAEAFSSAGRLGRARLGSTELAEVLPSRLSAPRVKCGGRSLALARAERNVDLVNDSGKSFDWNPIGPRLPRLLQWIDSRSGSLTERAEASPWRRFVSPVTTASRGFDPSMVCGISR
jgi:hypothetical protein